MSLIYETETTCPKCGSDDFKVTDTVVQGINPLTLAADLECNSCGNTATANMAVDTVSWDEGKCPECGDTISNEGYGHDYDAVREHGKCTCCLGHCPYCNDTH
jgi:uncharacterized Zn finger protein